MSTQIQNFYESQITRNWTATTGDFNVSVAPTISEGIIVISPSDRVRREIVRFTATGTNAYGPFVTVSNIAHRGLGGTTAQVHTIGEKVRMNITAEHWTEIQDDIDSIVAGGLPAGSEGKVIVHNGTTWEAGSPVIIETTTGTTHSLTTMAGQKVIVWAKGTVVHPTAEGYSDAVSLNYNSVEKDTVLFAGDPEGASQDKGSFSLMYTETPGAGTQNITVTTTGSSITNVVIIVMKIG